MVRTPVAAGLAVLSAVLAVGGLVLGLSLPEPWQPARAQQGVVVLPDFAAALVLPAIGAFIVSRQPRHGLAWLAIAGGLACGLRGAGASAMAFAASMGELTAAGCLRWVSHTGWAAGGMLLAVIFPLYLPDGRLPSRRWRPVVVIATVLVTLEIVRGIVRPDPPLAGYPWPVVIPNPLGWDALAGLGPALNRTYYVSVQILLLVSLLGMALRARRGNAVVRRQIAWPLTGFALYVAGMLAGPDFSVPAVLGVFLTALGICFSVLRYRLFDLDVIVSRALVGAGIAAVVGTVYLAVSGAVGLAVSGYDRQAGLAAALVAGAFFHPLRTRLRRLVDQHMYGRHGDPRHLAERLSAEAGSTDPARALTTMAEITMDGLGVAGLAVEVRDTRRTELGRLGPRPRELPLVWHNDLAGTLLLGPPGERRFSREHTDRLIAAALPYLADVAHAIGVSEDLQRTREQIMAAREEERRRLRRDLDHGLGQALAGMAQSLNQVRTSLHSAPSSAEQLLGDLREGMDGVAQEVRELVYGLRPPTLESLGLEGAVRALAGSEARVSVRGSLTGLPVALEGAAYRIVREALADLRRHARGHDVRILLDAGAEALVVRVEDDGPWAAGSLGSGLEAMRERAAEVGGTCVALPRPGGGTRVEAALPWLSSM
ncbi:histidine kinase [Nonomuraea sp. NPDC050310]|uniref:sensor histidine kinase n=1 Tax=unclassified Nonomuraea TaxID=2593643 RepID=UPI0033CD40DA